MELGFFRSWERPLLARPAAPDVKGLGQDLIAPYQVSVNLNRRLRRSHEASSMSRTSVTSERFRAPGSSVPVLVAAFVLAGGAPAFAIPSPELVVGSLSSISQLLALVSAILGGGAAVVGARAAARGGAAAGISRWAWRVAAAFGLLFVVSLGFNIYQYTTYAGEKQARLEATIARPMARLGGRSLDPTLKEVTYGDQLRHPRGMSTEDIENVLLA